jgi:hypothetical protein
MAAQFCFLLLLFSAWTTFVMPGGGTHMSQLEELVRVVVHSHTNLLKLLCEPRNAVILQNDLVQFLVFLLIEFCQFWFLFVGEDIGKHLWDSRLDTYRNVFLNEVLDHSEVVAVVIDVQTHFLYINFYHFKVSYEFSGVAFPSFDIVCLILQFV